MKNIKLTYVCKATTLELICTAVDAVTLIDLDPLNSFIVPPYITK